MVKKTEKKRNEDEQLEADILDLIEKKDRALEDSYENV